jgi:hypothetical protein
MYPARASRDLYVGLLILSSRTRGADYTLIKSRRGLILSNGGC